MEVDEEWCGWDKRWVINVILGRIIIKEINVEEEIMEKGLREFNKGRGRYWKIEIRKR